MYNACYQRGFLLLSSFIKNTVEVVHPALLLHSLRISVIESRVDVPLKHMTLR